MMTHRFLSSLVVAMALTACGSDEPHKAPPASPPAAAPKPVAPPAPPPAAATTPPGPPAATCIGKWTSGETGALTCTGPEGRPFDKAAFRLVRVCVNDTRVSTYSAGGKTVTLKVNPTGKTHCAAFDGVAEVPESCSCVAPAGGDCNPPAGGFVCVAIGHAAPTGG
jgi:hypothetical protein